MHNEEVTRDTLENLLISMQQEIMNRSADPDEEDSDDPSGAYEEGLEEAIRNIRGHFGLKDYPFSGKAWWEKPSTEILRRCERSGELEGCLR